MEANQKINQNKMKEDVSLRQSIYPPNANSPSESTSPAPPPSYNYPAQSPPLSGMPYPQYYQPLKPNEGYPQPYAAPSGGQPYYPQPGVGYPGPTIPNYQQPQPQQQQQQQVVVMNNQTTGVTPVIAVHPSPVYMGGAIVLSCIVFWCCGWLCGGIAFILALVGQSSAAAGDSRSAIQMRNASYGLSIAGIVSGIIIIAVVAGIYGSVASNVYKNAYKSTPNRCYSSYYNYYYDC